MLHYSRRIIGYHGCDVSVAQGLLNGGSFKPSDNAYDWLGPGIYFWEWGPDRAWRFAHEQVKRGKVKDPAIVGALVELGRCFDLMDTRYTEDLAAFYPQWEATMKVKALPVPANRGKAPDFKGRYLDCAVLSAYLDLMEAQGMSYDTVRCGFLEGDPVFPGSGIHKESHIQLAVRNPDCILGVFKPIQGGGS